MTRRHIAILLIATAACRGALDQSRPPAGLAQGVLAQRGFRWVDRTTGPFRAHFLAGSYAALHQDSLLARLAPARDHALRLLEEPDDTTTMEVFFVEDRPQMESLLGRKATGFAEPGSGTVLLMTNPRWRAFERHEIMHVVAERHWGPAAAEDDWLREGLAQFADGSCGRYPNEQVAVALSAHGWIPLASLVRDFRREDDLLAYLEAASLAGFIHRANGVAGLHAMWHGGPKEFERLTGEDLSTLEDRFEAAMASISAQPDSAEIAAIRKKGCG